MTLAPPLPTRSARDLAVGWCVAVAVAGLALGAFALSWRLSSKGAIGLVGAERILAGELPYRDFWTLYAPGSYYLLAGVFAVFGTSFLASAVAGSLLCAGAVALAHRVGLALFGHRGDALAVALVLAGALFATPYRRSLQTYPPALCCVLLAWLAAASALRAGRGGPQPRATFAAGLACGAAALFKHDVAAYTAIAIAAGLVVCVALDPDSGRGRARRAARAVGRFALGAAIPVLPVAAVFLSLAARDVVQDLLIFPATDFRTVRGASRSLLALPDLLEPGLTRRRLFFRASAFLGMAVPFALWLMGLAAAAWSARRRDARSAALGVAFGTAFALHWLAGHVQLNTHFVSLSLYGVCLGVLLLRALAPRLPSLASRGLRLAALGAVFGWLALLVGESAYDLSWELHKSRLRRSTNIAKLVGMRLGEPYATEIEALVALVQERVPPGQPVYVGVHRHDAVIAGTTFLQAILDRPPATRYHEIHPGVVDTEPVQREMRDALERRRVQLVVLEHLFDDETLDRFAATLRGRVPDIGATLLDAHLRERFEPAERIGSFTVWVRRQD